MLFDLPFDFDFGSGFVEFFFVIPFFAAWAYPSSNAITITSLRTLFVMFEFFMIVSGSLIRGELYMNDTSEGRVKRTRVISLTM